MSDMTSTEKKRRLILFSLLGVALAVPILLASFFLFAPEKPPATARLTSARTDAITGKAERTKMRRDHLIPPSRQALAVLEKLRAYSGGNQYVFPSYHSKTFPLEKPLSAGPHAARNLKRMKCARMVFALWPPLR